MRNLGLKVEDEIKSQIAFRQAGTAADTSTKLMLQRHPPITTSPFLAAVRLCTTYFLKEKV